MGPSFLSNKFRNLRNYRNIRSLMYNVIGTGKTMSIVGKNICITFD